MSVHPWYLSYSTTISQPGKPAFLEQVTHHVAPFTSIVDLVERLLVLLPELVV